MSNYYRQAEYFHCAHHLHQLPEDSGLEVAFAGRSNAGKSSALNAITGHKGLARTSKTPGRTQQIIFFQLDAQHRLVDLPGYGYAKVPAAIKHHWEQTLAGYLHSRESLKGLIMLMDVRHPLMPQDIQMVQWCAQSQLPLHILLTKADKLSRGQAGAAMQKVRAWLGVQPGEHSVQLFSALKLTGIADARLCLNRWLNYA